MKVNVLDWTECYPEEEYLSEDLSFAGLVDSVGDSYYDVFVNNQEDYEQYDYILVHGVYFSIHKMKFEDGSISVRLT